MELLIVLLILVACVPAARWLIVRHKERERIKRRLEEWVEAPPKEPK